MDPFLQLYSRCGNPSKVLACLSDLCSELTHILHAYLSITSAPQTQDLKMIGDGLPPLTQHLNGQDPTVLAHTHPTYPPCPLLAFLAVENFSQRISLIREMRSAETEQRRPTNNNVVIKHSQGP